MILPALHFLQAADPMPRWLRILTVTIGIYAAGITAANPQGVDEALAILLLWQMLSASRGFVRQASAGHFDAALVRWPRFTLSIAHAIHATWPVVALWLAVAAIEAVRGQRSPAAFETGRLAAFIFASIAAWAVALPAARTVTGTLWLTLIVAAATTRFGPEQYAAMLERPGGSGAQLLHAAVLTLVCPFLLIGDHIPVRTGTASILLVVAVMALVAGIRYLQRRDYPLEAAL